jgi:hypothetical protein
VFWGRISGDALMVCDGALSYRVLEEKNVCSTAAGGPGGFYRINEVNNIFYKFLQIFLKKTLTFLNITINTFN